VRHEQPPSSSRPAKPVPGKAGRIVGWPGTEAVCPVGTFVAGIGDHPIYHHTATDQPDIGCM
jgi:hypothetical protein